MNTILIAANVLRPGGSMPNFSNSGEHIITLDGIPGTGHAGDGWTV